MTLNEFLRRIDSLITVMEEIPDYETLRKHGISDNDYHNDFASVVRCKTITKANMKKLNTLYHKYKRVK